MWLDWYEYYTSGRQQRNTLTRERETARKSALHKKAVARRRKAKRGGKK